jgi:PBP1b-binding outer membrane lipoprotein LpoB
MCLAAAMLLNGCISFSLGGGSKSTTETAKPTVGQQLVDLQKAHTAGAITDAEFQAQKAKIFASINLPGGSPLLRRTPGLPQ